MKQIAEMVENIDEEIEGAKCYAETYLMCKASGSERASTYKQMAQDELNHATNLHKFVSEEIEKLSKVYEAPAEMQEKWNISHKKYIEKVAWIKQMLSM